MVRNYKPGGGGRRCIYPFCFAPSSPVLSVTVKINFSEYYDRGDLDFRAELDGDDVAVRKSKVQHHQVFFRIQSAPAFVAGRR